MKDKLNGLKINICVIWFLVSSVKLLGQNMYFTTYTTSNGLSQNSVYSIIQSKEGFMWFGTQAGLNRFDGKEIVQIQFKVDSFYLSSKMITSLFIDKRDQFWLGTTNGLGLYDRYTNTLIDAKIKYKNFKFREKVWIEAIDEDNDNNIWVQSRNGIFAYSTKLKKELHLPNIISNNKVQGMSIDRKSNSILIATENKIYQYSKGKINEIECQSIIPNKDIKIRSFQLIQSSLWVITTDNNVWILNNVDGKWENFKRKFPNCDMLLDPSLVYGDGTNKVWVGSRSEGIMCIDLKENKCERSSLTYHPNALTKNFILSIYNSNDFTTWIGISGGGVAKYSHNQTDIKLWRNESSIGKEPPDNMILSLYTDNDEDIYQGTLSGGLLHTNIKNNTYQYYKLPKTINRNTDANNIYTIVKGNNDDLWLATWGGLCVFNKKIKTMNIYNDSDGKTTELYTLLRINNSDTLIVGGLKCGLKFFNIKTKKWLPVIINDPSVDLSDLRPRYISQLNANEILISSESQNLMRYNFKTGEIIKFQKLLAITGTSRHHYIDGNDVWVGTEKGIYKVNLLSKEITKAYTKNIGLSDEVIYSVMKDNSGRLLASCNRGIISIDLKKDKIEKFNENDGLQSMEFNTASCLKDSKGKLWFGGVNGINSILLNNYSGSTHIEKPLISKIHVMNEPVISDTTPTYLSNLNLTYKQNFISIDFQSPTFNKIENIIYAYKLEGLDTSWVLGGNRNFVNYSHLRPGDYTFWAKASNDNITWSDPSKPLRIHIGKPWYLTWWFVTLTTGALISCIYSIYKWHIANIRNEAAIQQKLHETELAALKAQMNPHFIFNCINSIDAFIQSNDKYNASIYLNKFAKLIRNILESSKQNLVSFEKDIETMKIYTELEEMRSEHKFKTEFNIDPTIYSFDVKIPPLIVQPYIENAIIHGLRNKIGGHGLLEVNVTKNAEQLIYIIKDNGIGRKEAAMFSKTKEFSYGMQLSEDRVKLFNNDNIQNVEIIDLNNKKQETGTIIKIKLNIS